MKATKVIKHTTHISNVLVIGSGGSGLRAAIEAKKSGVEVTVIGKRIKEDVHTVLAAGGINAAFGNVDPEDSWKQHFADTMIEGYGLSEPRMVELMAKEAPELVTEIDKWGANFAKLENGKMDQRFFWSTYASKNMLFWRLYRAFYTNGANQKNKRIKHPHTRFAICNRIISP